MKTRSDVIKFAEQWLKWYPETTEAELRDALRRRFLAQASLSELAGAATMGGLEGAGADIAEGCLPALVLGPLVGIWHRLFPAPPVRPEDIDAALAELRAAGR